MGVMLLIDSEKQNSELSDERVGGKESRRIITE